MREIPREVIFRHAFHKVAKYFAEKVEAKRRSGYVAVLVEEAWDTLYFMPCDEYGYPQRSELRALEVPSLMAYSSFDAEIATETITCYEVSIIAERPLLSQRYDVDRYPYVFLWSGRKMGKEMIPVEKLNVQELMKLAQMAVIKREGLVIDEALNNKIYK